MSEAHTKQNLKVPLGPTQIEVFIFISLDSPRLNISWNERLFFTKEGFLVQVPSKHSLRLLPPLTGKCLYGLSLFRSESQI